MSFYSWVILYVVTIRRPRATRELGFVHLVLFRLVDEGKADVAAYALKFIL